MAGRMSSASYLASVLSSCSQPFLPQIGVSYMPMVITSNWPPLVAMSVVTRWRSTPSSSVTHLSLMSWLVASKCLPSFCISIMWPLFTVAITSSVAACAMPALSSAAVRTEARRNFTVCLLGGMVGARSTAISGPWRNSHHRAAHDLYGKGQGMFSLAFKAWDLPYEVAQSLCPGPSQTPRVRSPAPPKPTVIPMRKRILLLEDEQAIADTLLYVLRGDGFEVRHARLVSEALQALHSEPPDLAILDVGVPDGNGFDVCRAIRKTSDLPIVFLTARSEEIDRILGLELGADDYVSKPFSPREVCARVRAILRRSAPGRDAAAASSNGGASVPAAALQLDEAAQRIRCGDDWLSLTRYEYLLLANLLQRPQRIFSRAELMDLVWAEALDTSERTVDAHIKLLRAKLRERGVSGDLIQTHRNMGYSLQV